MKVDDRVEVLYPAHYREFGTITRIVPRHETPAMLTIRLDSGVQFICDETLVRLKQ